MNKLLELIEKVAQKDNIKINLLQNGVMILIKDNKAFVQISVIRNIYYIRYLTKERNYAFVIYKIDENIIEKIIKERLDEEPEAIKIPDV